MRCRIRRTWDWPRGVTLEHRKGRTFVHGLLAEVARVATKESDFEGLAQVVKVQQELLQRVLEDVRAAHVDVEDPDLRYVRADEDLQAALGMTRS